MPRFHHFLHRRTEAQSPSLHFGAIDCRNFAVPALLSWTINTKQIQINYRSIWPPIGGEQKSPSPILHFGTVQSQNYLLWAIEC